MQIENVYRCQLLINLQFSICAMFVYPSIYLYDISYMRWNYLCDEIRVGCLQQ